MNEVKYKIQWRKNKLRFSISVASPGGVKVIILLLLAAYGKAYGFGNEKVTDLTILSRKKKKKGKKDTWINITESHVSTDEERRMTVDSSLKPDKATPQDLPQYTLKKMKAFIKNDQRIHAIKCLREGTFWGLKEAKDFVDKHWFPDTMKIDRKPQPQLRGRRARRAQFRKEEKE